MIPIVEKFPKGVFARADVERERTLRLSIQGVLGSEISDGGDTWVLTTTFPSANAGAAAAGVTSGANPVPRPAPAAELTVTPAGIVIFASLVPGGFFSSNPNDSGIPRSIRTNNPGALNISDWQKIRPGFVGVTGPDGSGNHNKTTIYRTPEHGVAAWFHLLSVVYGLGGLPSFRISNLAQRYAGTASGPDVDAYVTGWTAASNNAITVTTDIDLGDAIQTRVLARAMFQHEAGKASPLQDRQIDYAVAHERAGTIPS